MLYVYKMYNVSCSTDDLYVYFLGIHDIWPKTISSKRRLVECDIWSIRRFVDYDVWSTTTIGRKIRRITSKFGRKLNCTEKIKIVYIYGSHISNIVSRQYQ